MMRSPPAHARLTIDRSGLAANWRCFAAAGGSAVCGAAIKADGYGLGSRIALETLYAAGAREFFVAHWCEVAALGSLPDGARVAVLHGAAPDEIDVALSSDARPVLVTAAQVAAWKPTGQPCDVMVDTGMNRLGLTPAEAAVRAARRPGGRYAAQSSRLCRGGRASAQRAAAGGLCRRRGAAAGDAACAGQFGGNRAGSRTIASG